MHNPLVYLIILNWNGMKDTLECLESVRAIDYPNCKIVVVDNGSHDDTTLWINEHYPQIRAYRIDQAISFPDIPTSHSDAAKQDLRFAE